MSFVLLYTTLPTKPSIRQAVDLNADSECGLPVKRNVDRILSEKVYSNEYQASSNIPDSKHTIYAIPYLADGVKDTAKMTAIRSKINETHDKSSELKAEWRIKALAVKVKSCPSCKSKIAQNHEAIERNTHTKEMHCPNCRCQNYLLTQGSRTKIEKNKEAIDKLHQDYALLKEKEVEKAVKKKATLNYIVGGWLHECDVPEDGY